MKTVLVFSFMLAISAWPAEAYNRVFGKRYEEGQAEAPHVVRLVESEDGAQHELLVVTVQEKEGENMVVVDYDKGLSTLYRASDDKCFLIGGVDANVNYEKQASRPYDMDNRLQYKVADDLPVTDKSLIPEAMQDICADKEVKWLERDTDAVKQAKRTKRKIRKSCVIFCW